jgi:hypothetical protein
LTPFDDDATELTFVQAQLNSGENFGDRRNTFNLGVGYRQLLEQGQSIAGINLFADYESKSKHKRHANRVRELHFYTKNSAFDIRLSNTIPNVSSGFNFYPRQVRNLA